MVAANDGFTPDPLVLLKVISPIFYNFALAHQNKAVVHQNRRSAEEKEPGPLS